MFSQEAGPSGSGAGPSGEPAPGPEPTGFDRHLPIRDILYVQCKGTAYCHEARVGIIWKGKQDHEEVSWQLACQRAPFIMIDWCLRRLGFGTPSPMDTLNWPIGGITASRDIPGPDGKGAREFFVEWRGKDREKSYDCWMSGQDIRTRVPQGPVLLNQFRKDKVPVYSLSPEDKGEEPPEIKDLLFSTRRLLHYMTSSLSMHPFGEAPGVLHRPPPDLWARELVHLDQIHYLIEREGQGGPTLVQGGHFDQDWPQTLLRWFGKRYFYDLGLSG
jgi:hypothetical protein